MAHNFTLTFPETYTKDLKDVFSMLGQRLVLQNDIDPTFVCKSSRDSAGHLLYYAYPRAIERIETKRHTRSFPIILYDLRRIEELQEDNAELRVTGNLEKEEKKLLDEDLPVVHEDDPSTPAIGMKSQADSGLIKTSSQTSSEFLNTSNQMDSECVKTTNQTDPALIRMELEEYNNTLAASNYETTVNTFGFSFAINVKEENLSMAAIAQSAKEPSVPMLIPVKDFILEILSDNHIELTSHSNNRGTGEVTLAFSCPASASEVLLEMLENIGFDRWFGKVFVTVCDLYRSCDSKEEALTDGVTSRLILVQEMINIINDGATCTFDYLLLLISAGIMAGLGLVANSTAVVVASMLVSPLMGPILGIAFAGVVHDRNLLWTSVKSEIYGILICFACGIFIGLVGTPLAGIQYPPVWPGWPTTEMSNRGDLFNCLIGFAIAIPSGVGVALGISGRNTSSLVGVAISASLLPPCVNAGILWAYGIAAYFFHCLPEGYSLSKLIIMGCVSFLLCIVNILAIVFIGMGMFKLKELVKLPQKSQLWSEDIRRIRTTFDKERKMKATQAKSGYEGTHPQLNRKYAHTTLHRDIHRTYNSTTLDVTLSSTNRKAEAVDLQDLFKKYN